MSDACGSCSSDPSSCGGCSEAPEDLKMQKTLARIKHKIVVMSGKGGVGKSTVAANIAVALAQAGKQVGLLDVDVHGPSIPRLLSLQGEKPVMGLDSMEPISWSKNLWVMSLGFLLEDPNDAVIWRGPVKIGLIKQFIEDVDWRDLDYLIVDCPPGTGDEPLSAMQNLGPDAHAVIVTTPQGVAVDDVRRSVSFVRQLGNPIMGIVENMSGFICPDCGSVHNIFNSGGGAALARETGVNFLGAIPLDPEVARAGDEGFPMIKVHRDTPTGQAMQTVIQPMLDLPEPKAPGAPNPLDGLKDFNGRVRIAIPLAEGGNSGAFGEYPDFALIDVDKATRLVMSTSMEQAPGADIKEATNWLATKDVGMVIAGDMDALGFESLESAGIKAVTAAKGEDPDNIVNKLMSGLIEI